MSNGGPTHMRSEPSFDPPVLHTWMGIDLQAAVDAGVWLLTADNGQMAALLPVGHSPGNRVQVGRDEQMALGCLLGACSGLELELWLLRRPLRCPGQNGGTR